MTGYKNPIFSEKTNDTLIHKCDQAAAISSYVVYSANDRDQVNIS